MITMLGAIPVLSRDDMQAADRHAIETLGIPSLVLMEVAGRAVADAVHTSVGPEDAVLILAGTGNNGADGLVAARHLFSRGIDVEVVTLGSAASRSPDFEVQQDILRKLDVPVAFVDSETELALLDDRLARVGLVVDAVFGTGLTRPIDGYRALAIEHVEAAGHEVVAIDMPSGVDASSGAVLGAAVAANLTVSFQWPKIGQLLHPGRALCGELEVADIGIVDESLSATAEDVNLLTDLCIAAALPERASDSHKGTYGHLLVVAGAPDRIGAGLLAARAALRAGVGLVTLASDAETIARAAPALDEVMGHTLGASLSAETIIAASASMGAVAIGPSLEPTDELTYILRELLTGLAAPIVVDAGALRALGHQPKWLTAREHPTVLTPHPGEMAGLLGVTSSAVQADRLDAARRLAALCDAEVILKGASTIVASPGGHASIIIRGNPGMASGGTGDALTGVVGALLAGGLPAPVAARVGAQLHAKAGDLAFESLGDAMIASDLIAQLPAARAGRDDD